MSGKEMTDVFVLRRLTEKFKFKDEMVFFVFIDVEKVFDQVPRKVLHFALRRNRVLGCFANRVMLIYKRSKKPVSVKRCCETVISLKNCVHQASA